MVRLKEIVRAFRLETEHFASHNVVNFANDSTKIVDMHPEMRTVTSIIGGLKERRNIQEMDRLGNVPEVAVPRLRWSSIPSGFWPQKLSDGERIALGDDDSVTTNRTIADPVSKGMPSKAATTSGANDATPVKPGIETRVFVLVHVLGAVDNVDRRLRLIPISRSTGFMKRSRN